MTDGLETVVGSGGERIDTAKAQRLARALDRPVLADPPIAIFDEATADTGSASARGLEDAADRALQGGTALVVAHRLTQAHRADRIIVLSAGRVQETGTHEQLVSAGGAYATLWDSWASSRPTADTIEANPG